MRISDWSSDVCSSDLQAATYRAAEPRAAPKLGQPAASRYSQGTLGGPTLRKRSICRPECGDIGIACRHVGECVLRRLPTELASGSPTRSEEHTSELQSLMRISYAVFCLKKNINTQPP